MDKCRWIQREQEGIILKYLKSQGISFGRRAHTHTHNHKQTMAFYYRPLPTFSLNLLTLHVQCERSDCMPKENLAHAPTLKGPVGGGIHDTETEKRERENLSKKNKKLNSKNPKANTNATKRRWVSGVLFNVTISSHHTSTHNNNNSENHQHRNWKEK